MHYGICFHSFHRYCNSLGIRKKSVEGDVKIPFHPSTQSLFTEPDVFFSIKLCISFVNIPVEGVEGENEFSFHPLGVMNQRLE